MRHFYHPPVYYFHHTEMGPVCPSPSGSSQLTGKQGNAPPMRPRSRRAQPAGPAAPGLSVLPTGPGAVLPASVGSGHAVARRRQPVPHLRALGRIRTGETRLLPEDTGSRSVTWTTLPIQVSAPSPSPTPEGQRAAPGNKMADGHRLRPQGPAEKSIRASR